MKSKFLQYTLILLCCIGSASCHHTQALTTQAPMTHEGKAKYVFYFIGDGMGTTQVDAAESYLGAVRGRYGIDTLCFPSFPYVALVNTCSASSGITDSAAGGTALATGIKTRNGALGLDSTLQEEIHSIAALAHQRGMAVGVTTTVTTDHATPAAFYAHVKSRKDTKTIREQRNRCGYDYIKGAPDGGVLPYRLDRKQGEWSLSDITRQAIDSLSNVSRRKDDKGFFLMAEGGMIDWACHSNDPGAMIGEILDFDDAIQQAYAFYRQHPDETLIVVTADHETGGLVIGRGRSEHRLGILQHQQMTVWKLGETLNQLRKEKGSQYNWALVADVLRQHFGFWTSIPLTDAQSTRLREAYEHIEQGIGKGEKTLYQEDDELCKSVRDILCEQAMLTFALTTHSAGYVPCFAIGVGAHRFTGRLDNTDIPQRIQQALGWK